MTSYKQNVPEQIFVSPAIYLEVLAHLDPFQSEKNQDDFMLAGLPNARNCPHFQIASYGCENCFAGPEECMEDIRAAELAEYLSIESDRR